MDVPFDESGESHSATDIVHSDEELGDIGGGGDPEEVEVVEVGPKRKRSLGSAGDESPTKRGGEADGVPFALQGPGFEAFTHLQDHPEPPEFLRGVSPFGLRSPSMRAYLHPPVDHLYQSHTGMCALHPDQPQSGHPGLRATSPCCGRRKCPFSLRLLEVCHSLRAR